MKREHRPGTLNQYSSTPHLFVYQPSEPEPIYSSTNELQKHREKEAIQKITEKYDSFKKITCPEDDDDDDSGNGDEELTVTDDDIFRIESFFRGHKTQVFVCAALANLYFSTVEDMKSPDGGWDLKYTGVPLVLLDYGETKSRNKRGLQILLAEKGTGFMLWRDALDNLSNYRATDATFHTMHVSTDHRMVVGLSFDDEKGARDFHTTIETLTNDPSNISLSMPNSKKKKKPKPKKPVKVKPPNKGEISQPCCFQHITNVDLEDRSRYFSLQTLVTDIDRRSST